MDRRPVTPMVRVAAAPINWGVYRLDPANPPADEVLDAIVAAGYEGSELGPLGYLAADPADVGANFAGRGLALVSAFAGVALAEPLPEAFLTEFAAVAALLAAGGASTLLISDAMSETRAKVSGRVERHPDTWWNDHDWRRVCANLETLIAKAGAHGLDLTYHPHAGSHVESGREIARLLAETRDQALRFCLDTGHILIGGVDPVEVLDWAGDRVAHVHAKDVDGEVLARLENGDLDYVGAVAAGLYCDLGDGAVDWNGIAAGLARTGFAGWVVVEQDRHLIPGDRHPAASLLRNRVFVRSLLKT